MIRCIWSHFLCVLKGKSPTLSFTSSLLHSLGSVTVSIAGLSERGALWGCFICITHIILPWAQTACNQFTVLELDTLQAPVFVEEFITLVMPKHVYRLKQWFEILCDIWEDVCIFQLWFWSNFPLDSCARARCFGPGKVLAGEIDWVVASFPWSSFLVL